MKKKILSFICAFSMLATMFVSAVNVSAEGEAVTIEKNAASTDTKIVLDVYLEGYTYLTTYKFKIDLSAFKDLNIIDFPAEADVSTAVKMRNYIKDNYVVPKGIVATNGGSKSFLAAWNYQIMQSVSTVEPMQPSSKELVFQITLPLKKALENDVTVSIVEDGTTSSTYMYTVEEDENTDSGFSANPSISYPTCGSVTIAAPQAATPVLTGITLATDAETVAANTAVTFPAVTANYDIKDPEAVTAAWTLNGEAVTEFTTPAATFEDQTFVFTATYEGKTATYTVTVKALEFAATSPVGADMYFSKDGETSKVVKTFDCSVANCEDGLVTLTFAADGKTKAYENFEVAEGEATTEFKALIFNAPAGVTLTIAD